MKRALERIALEKIQRTGRLDLGNCGLTELPDALFELTDLEVLILSHRYWYYDLEKKQGKWIDSENTGEANNLKSLSPQLKLLRGVKTLFLNGQKDLSDLSPLKDLANLQLLDVSSTQVSDLSPLKDLANLQLLYVSSTQVSDLSPLKDLANLQLLNVSSTQVSDLSPLKDLANLQQLYVSSTQVSDLSPLKDLANLQQLYVYSTQVSDLSPLKDLANLQQLYVYSTQVSDLSPLKDLANLQQLYVSSTQVSDLSPLKDLANLQRLYVSETQVSDLSPLKDLANLQQLYVSSTQVSDLSPLKDLANLQLLYVSSTQVSDLSPLKDLANLQQLYVYSTQVSDLSPLKDLANLQQLYVYSTQVSDLSPLKDLANLQLLYVYSTQVSDLSPLKDLANLQQLYVYSTQVSDLSPLKDLANLQLLSVYSTQVSDLSPLKDLANLQLLNVYSTQVSDLSPLKDLANLQLLNVYSTQVSDLSPLKDLANLQLLNVYSTQVSDLSPLKDLANLQLLNVYSTQVSDLSPLKDLANLQLLNVYSTQVSDLSPLKDLANLQLLWVSSTQVSDLSPLKDLANLQRLDIDKTNVVDLKSLENLLNLEKIDLSGCQINDLSPLKALIEKGIALKWEDWKDEPGIYVKDCPLDKPLIAAIKKGNPAVLNYLNKPKERLFEARVLVLGEPRAGKTTLRRKLKSPSAAMPAQSESTKAFEIEIEPYKCDIEKDGERHKMIYNLWDFGGQDYYRLLHQLFVAEQSVYVIVTDTDRNKNEEEIDFWLQTIQRQGRDKQGNYGPVVLVQNPKTNREGSDFIDLKKRYPFWRQNESFLINLNALDEKADTFDRKELERFRRFKAHLEASFCQLNHVGREMPRQWVNVRRALAKLEKNNHISVEDFYTVCKKKGIVQITEQTDLLDIFHTLGYLLHYKDSDLQSMVILNREWVTDALYRVLDDAIVRENKGWFRKEDAQKIWYEPQYTNRTTELLALMQEFKLSYFNTASQKHIVPAKLPENTDGMPEWNTEHNVRLHLQYDWLPRVVPIQLIVSLHNYLVPLDKGEQWIWRNGCVLNGKALDITDAEVKIEDDWRNNRIEISARGEQSELLIRTLMKHWREVNQPFEDKVEVDKSILCHCEKCQTAARPFEFEYEDVLDARAANETLKCNKSRKDFQAAAILRGLFDEATASLDAFTRKGGRMDEAIKKLLEEGKLGEALDKLHNYDFATGLKARYSDSKRSYDLGLVSREDWNVEKARLVNTLLSYLSEYNEKQFLGGQYLKGKFREGFGAGKMDIPFAYDSVESPSQIHHHTYHNSQVYQSEHIGKIEHTHNIGISKEELDSLRQQIAAFTTTQQTELKAIVAEAAPTEAAKMSIGQKAMDWLNKNAEGIVGNVAASVYYDALKGLLGL